MAHIIGTQGNDIVAGTPEDDQLEGLGGDDTLTGGGGNDIIDGGTGADSMTGGPGDDIYYVDEMSYPTPRYFHRGDSATEYPFEGIDELRSTVTFTLSPNVENLALIGSSAIWGTGNELANVLRGNDGDNYLTGLGGGDTLLGGGGIDTARYDDSPAGVTVSLLTHTSNGGDAEGDTLAEIENLSGSPLTDSLVGDSQANRLYGWGGDDALVGGAGNDYLDGYDGDDTLVGGAGDDHLLPGAGNDWVDGGEGDDLIESWGSQADLGTVLTITGGLGRDTLQMPAFAWAGEVKNKMTDFTTGVGGDILDVDALLNYSADTRMIYAGGNPFDASVGLLRLVQQGPDTLLQWNGNQGGGAAPAWQTQAVLQHVTAATLTAENIKGGIPPNGGPVPGQVIVGTEGDDGWPLRGGVGADLISGLGGNDELSGWFGDDFVDGGPGDDHLFGEMGDDKLLGGVGNDNLSGGEGVDCASYVGFRSQYGILSSSYDPAPFDLVVVGSVGEGLDWLYFVEALSFADQSLPTTRADSALEYIASYTDLMGAFGANEEAGYYHFTGNGYAEGRTVTFNGFEYIASYADLMGAFGTNTDAGATHYITQGRFEGRAVSFDGLEYIASYGDLIDAYCANPDAGASHYITQGRFEARTTTFNGLEYIASYGDLINTFGTNADAGATHYIVAGHTEGRHISFDGLQYIASYEDLIKAFHTQVAMTADPDIGAHHYIVAGHAEHRAPDQFDAAQYLANYTDLQAAFGTNTEAATLHYITNGYFEHRTDHAL